MISIRFLSLTPLSMGAQVRRWNRTRNSAARAAELRNRILAPQRSHELITREIAHPDLGVHVLARSSTWKSA